MHWSRSHSARAMCVAAAGFALCASLLVSAPPANASTGGHLYLQIASSIERFPLVNGVPSTTPDLTIPGYGGALAVAPDGTVYALHAKGSGFDAYDIFAFLPGQTKPNREIILPRNGQCTLSSPPVQGLSVDGKGNLFVLVVYALSGARSRHIIARGDAFPICLGVAVFAPKASGKAKPLQAIAVNDYYFGAMTVSYNDDLYVNLADYGMVNEYANAVQNPQKTRTLPAQDNPAGATDKKDDVYLLDYGSGQPGAINVYAPSWASGPPTRSITLSSPFDNTGYMALRSHLLYLEVTYGSTEVGVFDARGNGPENPLAVVNYTGLQGPMAVGP